MIIKRNQNRPHNFELFGADFTVLLPREKAECTEIILEEWPEDYEAPINHHEEMEQVYYIIDGDGYVVVGDVEGTVSQGDLVYIPRLTPHKIKNVGKGKLTYLCFDLFPEGYPAGEETWAGHEKVIFEKFGNK